MVSTGIPALDNFLVAGYPSRSAILIEGSSGNEKETLGYKFLQAGLEAGDFCIYATRMSSRQVVEDAGSLAIDLQTTSPVWMCSGGDNPSFSPNDLPSISFGIKRLLREQKDRKLRIVFDSSSQLLLMHSTESVYRFLSQLLEEAKRYDAVFVATLDERMHQEQTLATMELLFDGVIRVEPGDKRRVSLLVKKMRGVALSSNLVSLALGDSGTPDAGSEAQKQRIAVLPFANIGADPGEEFFADGMTEEMISALSNLSGLAVISRTSTMQYKGTKKSLSEIARDLKVGTVLEGSVRRAGKKVRITVQLLDASEDKHLWSSSYDRELEDIFAVQSDIAKSVADALKVRVLEGESEQMQKKGTEKSDAYLLYLRGRGEWNSRTPDSVSRALVYFQQATQLDAGFALAFTGIADCYSLGGYAANLPLSVVVPKAKEAVMRALQLDNSLSEAHASYGFILMFFERRLKDAMEEFRRAIVLSPSNVHARQLYAELLQSMGSLEESLDEAKRGLELNPFDPGINIRVGMSYYLMERYDEALVYFRSASVPLGEVCKGLTYMMMSRFDEALESMNKAGPGLPAKMLVDLFTANVYARAGKAEEAKRILEENIPALGNDHTASRMLVAGTFATFGERDKTLDWLEKAVDAGELLAIFLKKDPVFKGFRTEPRFERLLEKIGVN